MKIPYKFGSQLVKWFQRRQLKADSTLLTHLGLLFLLSTPQEVLTRSVYF
jgi:hypothetical protein